MNEPHWLTIAKKYKGVKEAPGAANNQIILSWADRFGGWIKNYFVADSIPWCGLFVGNVMLEAEFTGLPKNPLGALNWATWGRQLNNPRLGCLMTFIRPGGGHVGFYVGEDRTHYHILGGNQSDAVTVSRIEKARLRSMNWPLGVALPAPQVIWLKPDGTPVTSNER